jgi:hypothetical protein
VVLEKKEREELRGVSSREEGVSWSSVLSVCACIGI